MPLPPLANQLPRFCFVPNKRHTIHTPKKEAKNENGVIPNSSQFYRGCKLRIEVAGVPGKKKERIIDGWDV